MRKFGLDLGDSLAGLVVITLALSAAATALGILVATLGRTFQQVTGISVIVTLTLAMLGGCMVPLFIMPDLMQTIAKVTPQAWALAGYQDILVRGQGVMDILTNTAALLGFAAVFFAIGVWRFKFE